MGDNMLQSDQRKDQHHHMIHLPHLKIPHSLHFSPRHHHDSHGTSKEKAHDSHKDVPRGCVAVYVGSEGEQRQRFVIPAAHVNHPLFQKLLKEAEEEYGFEQKGTITIPCHVSDFQCVEDVINEEHHQSHSSSSFCLR